MESDFGRALMQLEEDGEINLIGHKKAPTIRFMGDHWNAKFVVYINFIAL